MKVRGRIAGTLGAAALGAVLALAPRAPAHDGIGAGPVALDAAAAERALAGAEWLAARIGPGGEPAAADGAPYAQIEALIARARAGDTAGHGAFAAALAGLGYGDPDWAASLWVEEFIVLLAARDAAVPANQARSLAEIDAELDSLPAVPLDEAGAAERDRLLAERDLAAVPAQMRATAAALAPRIDAVLSSVSGGGRQ